ncbi:hydrolase HAD superfamily [Pyrenophora tritici-repentis]|uniref:Hydrolase n=2 Tax=Pyrenophora tritici-repentis TaxID=45151 RepID=A0A2W1DRJ9_9PLEO|nr:uncharacterized protein PTRG_11426 [Pyrenophora tritici-repentis Pt-1C-BFP]KAA8624449.1 hydrolase [Pyrenophora tritici-repentis]EDU44476.1 conserved hypothetical protein [Pyrenophora tritici-repentis Pt-1C-BFP]KAF7452853.1 hydrolase [Pyrenophora tritici-repentis]KAF7575880.1 hydrolase (HAD superfamily) [Pyrenophora tritici-repentis]KAG9377702.1 hypothetical protein A1F94_012105 [Pyrenophora tritici-repentis]
MPGVTNQVRQRTLILDLGDVLFHWSARDLTVFSPQTFHAVILSPTWSEYESGRITEEKAISLIGEELSLKPSDIAEGLLQCRNTLRVDSDLINELKKLKAEFQGSLKVYAMSNITKDDFARLKLILPDWSLFDAEYPSFEAGMTKLELAFFQHVIDDIGLSDPTSAIFVDDKVGNVNRARSFGIQGIVFGPSTDLIRELRNMLYDPVPRARQFMETSSKKNTCYIEGGGEFLDSFSQFLIHYELRDTSLISLSRADAPAAEVKKTIEQAAREARTWNYFIGEPVGTTKSFPNDIDSTSTYLLAFSPPAASANPVLDRIAANRHATEGLAMIYWCEKRPRIDPFVLVNAIRAFYHYNRGVEMQPELNYVRRILLHRGYVEGSEMYISGEPFLYFVSCLIAENPNAPEVQTLREPAAAVLRDYVNSKGDSFCVTARVLACQKLGVDPQSDIRYLKSLQEVDGGWELGWPCKFGRSRKRIGSRSVSTAWAIKALEHDARKFQNGTNGTKLERALGK